MPEEMLDIVNEQDQVVGQATRHEAHTKFLCHRVTSIWFYNDNGEILLQKRSLEKDTFPGTLSISASGHVEAGQTIEEAATREIQEETGVNIQFSDLHFLEKKIVAFPPLNHFGNYFAYKFTGDLQSLRFDPEEVEGFQWLKAEHLYDAPEQIRKNLHPFVTSKPHVSVYIKLLEVMGLPQNEKEIMRNAAELK